MPRRDPALRVLQDVKENSKSLSVLDAELISFAMECNYSFREALHAAMLVYEFGKGQPDIANSVGTSNA